MKSPWLTLAALLSIAPLFGVFPPWITAACLVASGLGLTGFRHPRLLGALALGCASGIFLQYGTLFSRDAGLALLALLVCLKLAELRHRRDAVLVIFLGYFLVMTWFFEAQSIPVAVAMLFQVAFLTANLARIHSVQPGILPGAKTAVSLLLQSVPLALILFLLFPRIPGPIWALPKAAHAARTGLGDSLSPGAISHLVLSDDVAFRVDFSGAIPPNASLYWRGPVLWDYDGVKWSSGVRHLEGGEVASTGGIVDYEVMQEPSGKRWVFGLDLPLGRPPGATVTADHQILSGNPQEEVRRYRMTSALIYEEGAGATQADLEQALRLPKGANPKAEALAGAWRSKSPREIVNLAIDFFRRNRFTYTLNPPLLGRSQVDDFLFVTRSGFCEHYASSFAYLMRAAGVPARIVTGYQGGELNPIGRYLIVRQSDAHAWVEIWTREKGWVRIDPTAIVSPARIDSGVTAALRADFPRRDAGWTGRIRLGWDAAANAWNQWVVGYGEASQKRFFGHLGLGAASTRDIAATLATVLSAIALVSTLAVMLKLKAVERDRVKRIYLGFCRKMARAGVARRPSEGPLAYGERIAAARPEIGEAARAFLSRYAELRYGRGGGPEEIARLGKMAKRLR